MPFRFDPLAMHAATLSSAADSAELEALLQDDDQDQGPDGPQGADEPMELGVLPMRNTVLYPRVVMPITVGRDKSIQLVREALKRDDRRVCVTAQREEDVEDPGQDQLYPVGTVARILRHIRMPDGSVTIFIQGQFRVRLEAFTQEEPYLRARVTPSRVEPATEVEAQALMRSLKEKAGHIIELSPNIPTEAKEMLGGIDDLGFLVYFIASNLNLDVQAKQQLLEESQQTTTANKVLELLGKEEKVLELSNEIQSKVKTDIDKQQREFLLRQQMRAIQEELGEQGSELELEEYAARAAKKRWPEAAQEAFDKELAKLERMNPNSPEYGLTVSYIEWLLDLPWNAPSKARLDLKRAQKILDRDHYGMEAVKERIIEFLAVYKLNKSVHKGPILCLYGPPGVGKTSLGKSVAEATGRSFVRLALGGVRDEAEIRGHRRTYIGSMPGRIIKVMKRAGTSNPVILLDEIDKVANDFRGDPASALLEVLDPEQNNAFNDHYLEVDYDLSQVLFITTANSLDTIHPALRDRMEIIELNGYTLPDKVQIAQRHLLPKAREDAGLKTTQLKMDEAALRTVIQGYTRESGVRKLRQQLDKIARSVAKAIVLEDAKAMKVTPDLVRNYLKAPRFEDDAYEPFTRPGVALGLAWTPVGGEVLYIESKLVRGKGRLNLTGQLGEVMKESAQIAYAYLKAQATELGIPYAAFDRWDLHIHIPAGAIPKDGPSAGITLLTAMASAYTQRLATPNQAMTGEMTLRGKVLPVGGITEKVLAAQRLGVTDVVMSRRNEKDVAEITPEHIAQMRFHYVDTLDDVLKLTLQPTPVPDALDLAAAPAPSTEPATNPVV